MSPRLFFVFAFSISLFAPPSATDAQTALAGLSADLPAPVAAEIAEGFAACRDVGGDPSVQPAFLSRPDLNGDGVEDVVLDYQAFDCANAWSYFCGSAGCPLVIWLSTTGDHRLGWSGHVQGHSVDATSGKVTLNLHGAFCTPPRVGAEGCTEVIALAGVVPPPPPEGLTAAALPAPPPVWEVTALPDIPLAAVVAAPAPLHALVAFCHKGEPVLGFVSDPQIDAPGIVVGFDFGRAPLRITAVRRNATGAAQMTLLAGPIVAALTGSASEVALSVDGNAAGILSLKGSTKAIRTVMSACPI